MTGKEALKQLEERYQKFIIEWYYISNMSKEERSRLFYMYDEEIKEIHIALEEFDKYKMAFEILKEKLHLRVIPCSIFEDETKKYLDYDGDYRKPMTILGNEEAELLEELMKDD